MRGICETAVKTRRPPELTAKMNETMGKLMTPRKAFELMGIPFLNKSSLRYMCRYWEQQERTLQEDCK